MIKITDNIKTIKLGADNLEVYDKYYEGLLIKPKFSYFVIELIIVVEDGFLQEIIKTYKGSEVILDRFVNKIESKDTIQLSENDFKRFEKLYNNMQNKKDYRKSAIVAAYAELLSYEYFQGSVLEDCSSVSITELFDDLNESYDYKKYRDEIIKESKKILKEKYKVE